MGKPIKHIEGDAGGYLVGKSHAENGIKAYNKATGQFIEMEGKEVVINKRSVADPKLRSFNGQMLTNRQILSKINESGGGVSFAEGGQVPDQIDYMEMQYEFGGETLSSDQILARMSNQENEIQVVDMTPDSITELIRSLNIAILEDLSKTDISKIQLYFFDNYVLTNPQLLHDYFEAIQILPKNYREYFQYNWLEDNEFLKLLGTNPFNLLPENLKPEIVIEQLDFSPSPNSDNLGRIMDKITNRIKFPVYFNGVYFNKEKSAIYASNGYTLLYINEDPHIDKSSLCLMGKSRQWYIRNVESIIHENESGCWEIHDNYPDVYKIIPNQYHHIVKNNTSELLQYLSASEYFTNPYSNLIIIGIEKDSEINLYGFNSKQLFNLLYAFAMIGHEEVDFCFSADNTKPVVIVPRGNSRKLSAIKCNTDMALIIPMKIDDVELFYPAYDLENNIATTINKFTKTPTEGNRFNINISDINNHPIALNLLKSMSKSSLKNEIKGSYYTHRNIGNHVTECKYYLYIIDFSASPYDIYNIEILHDYYPSAKNNSQHEALRVVLDALKESTELVENKNILDTIEGLEVYLFLATKEETQQIHDTIEGLKLLIS